MAEEGRSQQIRDAYNVRTGSKRETFKQANEGKGPKDPGRFTMAEVRKWYLENNIGALKKQTGFNSYVAPSRDHELQIDLFEYKFKQPERPHMNHTLIDGKEYELGRTWARKMAHVDPYGIIAINPFTKKLHIESVLGKHGRDDWKPALQQIINKIGKPKTIYTDPDATVKGKEVREWCKTNDIVSVITRQHAAVAERAIRTVKKRLDDKLDSDDIAYPDGDPASYWTKHVQEAVNWYNKENVQATTNMIPEEAEKPENEFDVKTNLEINAIHRRKYPVIEVGDEVRTFRKKKVGDKERMGNFHEGTETVKEITKSLGQTFYKLAGDVDPYIRADLHLIQKGKAAKAKEAVPAEVNAERNIVIEDGAKEEPPKKLTPEEAEKKKKDDDLVEAYYFKKMNKTARAKYLAKKEAQAEAEKFKRELENRKKINTRIDKKEAREDRMLARALR